MKLWQNVKFPKAEVFQAFPAEGQRSARKRILYRFPPYPCSFRCASHPCLKPALERQGKKWQVECHCKANKKPFHCLLYTLEHT